MRDDELNNLRALGAGLLYLSESDYPFDLFSWESAEVDAAQLVAQHSPPQAPIEEIQLSDFFAPLEQGDDGERFKQLHRVLKETLTDIHVFRVGQLEVQVYLIGRSPTGEWAGLHTVSVET